MSSTKLLAYSPFVYKIRFLYFSRNNRNSSFFQLCLSDGGPFWCSFSQSFKKCGYLSNCSAGAVEAVMAEASLLKSSSSVGL